MNSKLLTDPWANNDAERYDAENIRRCSRAYDESLHSAYQQKIANFLLMDGKANLRRCVKVRDPDEIDKILDQSEREEFAKPCEMTIPSERPMVAVGGSYPKGYGKKRVKHAWSRYHSGTVSNLTMRTNESLAMSCRYCHQLVHAQD